MNDTGPSFARRNPVGETRICAAAAKQPGAIHLPPCQAKSRQTRPWSHTDCGLWMSANRPRQERSKKENDDE